MAAKKQPNKIPKKGVPAKNTPVKKQPAKKPKKGNGDGVKKGVERR